MDFSEADLNGLQILGLEDRKRQHIAHEKNYSRFQGRFQSIIEKYEHNFADVGDEIDLETLEIAVDNGHLSAMRNDRDIGIFNLFPYKENESSLNSPNSCESPVSIDTVHPGKDLLSNCNAKDAKTERLFDERDQYLADGARAKPEQVSISTSPKETEMAIEQTLAQSSAAQDATRSGSRDFATSRVCHSAIEELGKSIARQISSFLEKHQLSFSTATEIISLKPLSDQGVYAPASDTCLARARDKANHSLSPNRLSHHITNHFEHDQSIWSQDHRTDSPKPRHCPRLEPPGLSEDDRLVIRLKHKEHKKWSEIKTFFPTVEQFETARNRWYARLSKRFPSEKRMKNPRHACTSRVKSAIFEPSITVPTDSITSCANHADRHSIRSMKLGSRMTSANSCVAALAADSQGRLSALSMLVNPETVHKKMPNRGSINDEQHSRLVSKPKRTRTSHDRRVHGKKKCIDSNQSRKVQNSLKNKRPANGSKKDENRLASKLGSLSEEDSTDELAF